MLRFAKSRKQIEHWKRPLRYGDNLSWAVYSPCSWEILTAESSFNSVCQLGRNSRLQSGSFFCPNREMRAHNSVGILYSFLSCE